MANQRYSERVFTALTDPITGKDLMGMSNTTDGGISYNLSKKILIEELAAWLQDNGFTIADNIVPTGTGIGLQESNYKIADLDTDGSSYAGQKDNFNTTHYQKWQGVNGNSYFNGKDLTVIAVNNANQIACTASETQMSNGLGHIVTIGGGASMNAKLQAQGDTNNNTTNVFGLENADNAAMFLVRNDGLITTANGAIGSASASPVVDFQISHIDQIASPVVTQTGSGVGIIKSTTGQPLFIKTGSEQRITCDTNGVVICKDTGDVVTVGRNGSFGARFHVQGDVSGDVVRFDIDGTIEAFSIDAAGDMFLKNGVGINEVSSDSDFSAATDKQAKTALAIKDYVEGLVQPQVIGGVFCSTPATTNVLNGTYVILNDTTTITPVSENVAQSANWILEYTGTATVKRTLQLTVNVVKIAGGGVNYDFALFKNNVLIPESELPQFKLESGGKGRSVVVTVPVQCATNDLFSVKVAGNGTVDDITCSGGTLILY